MSNVDPSLSRLNLPPDILNQLQALVDKPIPKANTGLSDVGPRSRYNTTLLAAATLGILSAVLSQLSLTDSLIAGYLSCIVGLLSMEWYNLHGAGLTRRRRAFLNVRNVLDTYQVRNREMGHLFQPEPDTPKPEMPCCGPPPPPGESPVNTIGEQIIKEKATIGSSKDAGFDKAVQDHYGGMYDEIKRMNAEMNTLKHNNQSMSPGALDYGTNQPLVPADIPLGGNDKRKEKSKKNE
ncbi:unnamed protein product [Bursaphelenchus xylophilus]|uniref:(pine wood nematode) hypothetical protein n=1 Tax=Bursaphelenchus xylophilus TaxID=6326 RepID=A0A1I7RYF3_BURXY|nr:unnamed protein product [Bursaphelenchus xylophilus]CAG9085701.1 unnamed protein product [Bursaphelenchus xylophilus]